MNVIRSLRISFNNMKLKLFHLATGLIIASFDIPAGKTCPAADLCKCIAIQRQDRSLYLWKKYPDSFCYAARAELYSPATMAARELNYLATLRQDFPNLMTDAIRSYKIDYLRLHSSGDIYSLAYWQKWLQIADRNPQTVIYGYSKLANRVNWLYTNQDSLPNFRLVYSNGGLMDHTAAALNSPTCYVIDPRTTPIKYEYSEFYTANPGRPSEMIPIACTPGQENNDIYYITNHLDFALLLHLQKNRQRLEYIRSYQDLYIINGYKIDTPQFKQLERTR